MRRKATIEADIKQKKDGLKINESMLAKLTTEFQSVRNKIRQIDKNTDDGANRIYDLNEHADRLVRDIDHYIEERNRLRTDIYNLIIELKNWQVDEELRIRARRNKVG